MVAQIDVPLDGTTEKVWLEVLWVSLIKLWGLGNVATAVCRNLKVGGGATTLRKWSSDVVGLLLAIELDLDLIKRVSVLLLQVHQVLVLLVIVRLSGSDKNCGDSQLHLDCVGVS